MKKMEFFMFQSMTIFLVMFSGSLFSYEAIDDTQPGEVTYLKRQVEVNIEDCIQQDLIKKPHMNAKYRCVLHVKRDPNTRILHILKNAEFNYTYGRIKILGIYGDGEIQFRFVKKRLQSERKISKELAIKAINSMANKKISFTKEIIAFRKLN